MKKFYRVVMYIIGLILLALGITLNTKTGLGVSPINAIPYSISQIFKINLGNATLCVYILFVIGQIILIGKKFRTLDLLQIPMSIIFSRVINIFDEMIKINVDNFVLKVILLGAAIILTGIGVAISVEMKLVPNAADGFTLALGERIGESLGFAKNVVDISSVIIAVTIGLFFGGKVVGIGLGTLIAVPGIGRSIALFNTFFKQRMFILASK
ncbi:hypothetical protein CLPUN_04850 [Clostridium puniceum]|uniref:Uncharacterized protein n=1 Tax=Clostridium puniceum TaxID=29367 RepID=A0A1S8TWM7_9CLOT|nr:DUF6198 family protein [Clostridium puniceum]OOM82146.1 hypothetical protein CLPUN_04850 [Clostridium puniceum]